MKTPKGSSQFSLLSSRFHSAWRSLTFGHFLVWCLLSAFLVGYSNSSFAQFQAPSTTKGPPMASSKLIEVKVTGSHRFAAEEIAAASGLPVGAMVVEEDFRKAVRQLGETGAFSDISFTYSYSSVGTKLAFQVADADKFVPAHFADFVWFSDKELFGKIHERVPLFTGALPATGRLADQVSDVLQALLVENSIPGHVEYLRTAGKSDH